MPKEKEKKEEEKVERDSEESADEEELVAMKRWKWKKKMEYLSQYVGLYPQTGTGKKA